MAFTSTEFALFSCVGLALYYLSPKNIRWIVLLILSYVFYLSARVGAVLYILFTTLTTYFGAIFIEHCNNNEDKKKVKKKKKLIAAAVLLLNFGLLYVVKYWNITLDLIKIPGTILRFNLIVPLGISFYIFQSMGYVIDVVRGKTKAEKNPFKLALFVSFFPQITQGPIGRYKDLSPQLYEGHDFSYDNIKNGVKTVMWGLIKKLVIADRAAIAASTVIDSYRDFNGAVILFAVILYCIQLYCDFSGGIDIARGVAKAFGINMAENFKRPIFAKTLPEFWRRWHITLGSWLKDYMFYPITLSKPFIALGKITRKHIKGKAGKILPTSLATFIVYFVIGIWHGANWKYILFGCWNGVLITLSLLLQPVFDSVNEKLHIKKDSWYHIVFCIVRTSVIVVIGRYITRADYVTSAISMLGKTFTQFTLLGFRTSIMSLGLTLADYIVILTGVLLVFTVELFEEKGTCLSEKIENHGALLTFVCNLLLIVFFVIFGVYRGNYIATEFIYKQF